VERPTLSEHPASAAEIGAMKQTREELISIVLYPA